MYETIIYETSENVATITLNRPKSLNAFTKQMNMEVTDAVKKAKRDKEIRCIVITGNGRGFCSGQDLSDVAEDSHHGQMIREYYSPMVKEIVSCEKPVVAAVNGVAAGAGFSLALACDFRILHEKASFLNAFIHVGLVPDTGNLYFLERLVGYGKALELSLLGEKVPAADALNLGLATKVFSDEEFGSEVQKYAAKLAKLPTKTIGLIKSQLEIASTASFEEYLEREAQLQTIAGRTEDHKEGLLAFLEKRVPNFKGY